MSASLLEHARQLMAANEQLQNSIVEDIAGTHPKTHRDKLFQVLRVKCRVDCIAENNEELLKYYKDKDGVSKEELDRITGGEDLVDVFFNKINDIREYHQSNSIPIVEDVSITLPSEEDYFKDTEHNGKHVDLHDLYMNYVNIKGVERIHYYQYLELLSGITLPKQVNMGEFYAHLEQVLEYMKDYVQKLYPLYPVSNILKSIEEEFYKTKVELFCTVCNKSFAKQTLFQSHMNSKKHKKKVSNRGSSINNIDSIDLLKMKVEIFSQLLDDQIKHTIQYLEAMQTRTFKEIIEERQYNTDSEEEEEVVEDESVIHNPLKIPLGWDGKPIPYWLYKLHGLNIEYKCEICGNFSYWGPRAFERHFKEWKHVNGLKALGIESTDEYKNITQIQDAIDLYRKLASLNKYSEWRPEHDEEFEDVDGNVFNKKTYDDLKKQGLL